MFQRYVCMYVDARWVWRTFHPFPAEQLRHLQAARLPCEYCMWMAYVNMVDVSASYMEHPVCGLYADLYMDCMARCREGSEP